MSYDVSFVIGTGSGREVEIADRNYTANVSGMWAKALGLPEKPWYRDGERVIGRRPLPGGGWVSEPLNVWGLRLLHDAPSSEAAGVLAAAVERMRANPDDYRPWNPENGWGSYEGALELLEWMADMAREYPATTIKVSS